MGTAHQGRRTGIVVGSAHATRLDDLPFIDALQKAHSKQLGFFPRAQMEGYLRNEWVLMAIDAVSGEAVGYCASRDRYLKRDELGAVFQMCVRPGVRRGLIGATLLRGVLERAAYGCKLFCCWCAQDLEANGFWEAMGFVPIAFRLGSETKGPKGGGRIHLFWQRRVRQGDATTPYWFPSQTTGGSLRADRLVLPIPAGTDWRDADALRAIVAAVPGMATAKALPSPRKPRAAVVTTPLVIPRKSIACGGLRLGPTIVETTVVKAEPVASSVVEKKKTDPRLLGAVRELRDRWLDHYNADATTTGGKYDVGRIGVERRGRVDRVERPALPLAA